MKKRANTKDSRAFRSNRTDFHKKIEKNSLAFGGLNMQDKYVYSSVKKNQTENMMFELE